MSRNEQTIINSLILPYLKQLGFTDDEIVYEKTFKIVLGRQVHKLSSKKFIPKRGHSDILCRRGDTNLFIIEAKSENHKLTQDDAEQGISYARLLKQIAPFVIVTNGKDTQIFDTISHEKLNDYEIANQSFWKNGCRLSSEEDLKIRDEALSNFMSYSSENLRIFSGLQVADRMKILRVEGDSLSKKYIPKLFVEREGVHDEFDSFLESPSRCFAIVGESGVGKTNVICNLAEYSLDRHMVLFFNGIEINRSIVDSIQEDFNWSFSASLQPEMIIARLNELTDGGNKFVCIFIDAIDESFLQNFDIDLDNFVRLLGRFPNIKICLSCKTIEWKRFIYRSDSPTRIAASLYYMKSKREGGIDGDKGSIFLPRFTNLELEKLEPIYKQAFHFTGSLVGSVKESCQLGFTLRVVAKVHSNQELPVEMDDLNFLTIYFEALLQKMDVEIARNSLVAIGKSVAKNPDDYEDNSGLRGSISEDDLREQLNLNLSEKIYPPLFNYDLLTRIKNVDGKFYVGFSNTILRDYIIAVLAYGLPDLDSVEFQNILGDLIKNSAGRSAIQFYLRTARDEHVETFKTFRIPGTVEFLNAYEKLIEYHFPNIRNRFRPHTYGEIGIVLANPLGSDYLAFGLRSLKKGDDKVVNLQDNDRESLDRSFYSLGAEWMPMRMNDSLANPLELAKINIADQLESIISNGQLFEGYSYHIAAEKIRAIVYSSLKTFGLSETVQKHQQPFENFVPPLSLSELKRLTYLDVARYYAVSRQNNSGKIT